MGRHTDRKRRTKRWWLRAGLLLPGLAASGCVCTNGTCVDRCATIPPGAIPAPVGTHVREFQHIQTAKAEFDDFVIYRHEWYMCGRVLGPYGNSHINMIVARLPGVPFPVTIEKSDNPELDQERRTEIVNYLVLAGIANAEERVVIGFPIAEGIYAEEGELIYGGYFGGGGRGGGFGGGTGGFGGGFGGGLGGFGGFGGFGGGFGGGGGGGGR